MKNLLADGRGGFIVDGRLCKSRVGAKTFVFVILPNFHEIFNFVFCKILLNFAKF